MRDDRIFRLGDFSGFLVSAVAGVAIAPAASAALIDIPLNVGGSDFTVPVPGGGLGLHYSTSSLDFGVVVIQAGNLNGAAMTFTPGALLPVGQSIDGATAFTDAETVLGRCSGKFCDPALTTGLFTSPTSGFLGVKFSQNDGVHFGWLGVTADPDAVQLTVTDLVFNDQPNTAVIIVPEPGSLAILAVGAAAVLAFRRRRQAAKPDVALAA
jgi:hypothetical protein